MRRRTLLGSVATASAAVAGCLDDVPDGTPGSGDDGTGGDGPTNGDDVECSAPFVDYDDLPDEIAAEVDAAFDAGTSETDERPLFDRAVSEGTSLWKDGAPHDHATEQDGEAWTLSFERQTAYDSPRELHLWNETTESVSATVTITDESGDRIVDGETHVVNPDDEERTPAVAAFGEYDVTVELDDGRKRTDEWDVSAPRVEVVEGVIVSIDEDEVSVDPLISSYDYVPCPMQWEDG